jgi:putative transposase
VEQDLRSIGSVALDGPKYRRPVLVGDVAARLKVLLTEKAAEMGATLHAMEVMPDHVHLFVESDPTRAPAHIAAQFKGYTSRVLRQEFGSLRSRLPTLWSRSYFASTVGHVSAATVQQYIETHGSGPRCGERSSIASAGGCRPGRWTRRWAGVAALQRRA